MRKLECLVMFLASLFLWSAPGLAAETTSEQYVIEFQVLVATGTKVVFDTQSFVDGEDMDSVEGINSMTVGDTKVDLDSDLMWNGRETPPEGSGIEILSDPRVLTRAGELAKIRTGSISVYLEQRDDDCYVRKTVPPESSPGIFMEVLPTGGPTEEDGTQTVNLDVKLRVTTITDRRPVPGLPFDVGQPTIQTKEIASQYRYRLGRWNVLSTHISREDTSTDRETLFVMVRVTKASGGPERHSALGNQPVHSIVETAGG